MENNTISKQLFDHYNGKQPVKTLRDEYVTAALTGLIARAGSYDLDMDLDVIVNRAFYIADRAMKVREIK